MSTLTIIPENAKPYVTFRIGDQLFALPVAAVRDVMRMAALTPVPLAPPVIAGLMNLRGQLVTALDMRARLALTPRPDSMPGMLVMVEQDGERFALVVDTIVDVATLADEDAEEVPTAMTMNWRDLATSIYTLGKDVLVILDVAAVVQDAIPQIEQRA